MMNCMTIRNVCSPVITQDGDMNHGAVRLKDFKSQWCIRLGSLYTTEWVP